MWILACTYRRSKVEVHSQVLAQSPQTSFFAQQAEELHVPLNLDHAHCMSSRQKIASGVGSRTELCSSARGSRQCTLSDYAVTTSRIMHTYEVKVPRHPPQMLFSSSPRALYSRPSPSYSIQCALAGLERVGREQHQDSAIIAMCHQPSSSLHTKWHMMHA